MGGQGVVGVGGVLGLPGGVGDHGGVAGALGGLDGVEGLRQAADLVDLDEDGVGGSELDAAAQAGGVGDEEVVAHELDPPAQALGEPDPALPVLLGEAVLDGDDGVPLDELSPVLDHLVGRERAPLAPELVEAILPVVELGGRGVHGEHEVLAGLEAGRLDGLHQVDEGFGVGLEIRREAALIPHAGGEPGRPEGVLERVVDLRAPPEAGRKVRRPHGHDHELLEVDVVVGVDASVQDVHHRHGEGVGVGPAEVGVERQADGGRGGAGDGERAAQDGVGAETPLVWGAVRDDHGLVDPALVGCLAAHERRGELPVDVRYGLRDALAEVAALVAVSKLDRLELAGRGAGGDDGAAGRPVLERDLDLDGRVAAGVQDLATVHLADLAHGMPFCLMELTFCHE